MKAMKTSNAKPMKASKTLPTQAATGKKIPKAAFAGKTKNAPKMPVGKAVKMPPASKKK